MTTSDLSVEQVLLESKNHWFEIKQTNSTAYDPVGSPRTRFMGFTAFNAIKKVQLEGYPRDEFWKSANWRALESALIRIIDDELAPRGSSYQREMLIRDGYSYRAARLKVEPVVH